MAGIYIHIPFCRKKCHYCNFFSLATKKMKEPFLRALRTEMELARDYLSGETVNTVYFGGGTPSVFRPEELNVLLTGFFPEVESNLTAEAVKEAQRAQSQRACQPPFAPSAPPSRPLRLNKTLATKPEISIELNPEDVDEAYVKELKDTRFNRFSLGVQSFFDDELQYLNRSHSSAQAITAVRMLQEAEFENISIDLIYGIPVSDDEKWRKNLETAFSLGVPHISAYALTVEQGTPLEWMIRKGRSAAVSDEAQVSQFRLLMQIAKDHGFEQYEISNFAKPGWHAVHNTNYWKGVPYLGLGPSAHSYNGSSRRWNVSNLSDYIAAMEKGEMKYEEEILTPVQKFNEYVMTSLRTMWGMDLQRTNDELKMTNDLKMRAERFVKRGLLREVAGVYFLTDEGKLFADGIAAELFVDNV